MKTTYFLILAVTAAFSFSACGGKSTPSNNSATPQSTVNVAGPANTSNSVPAPTATATPVAAPSAKLDSVYSPISGGKCKTTDSNEEEAWSIAMCEGIEGYQLEVYEDDIRQSMNIVAPSGAKSELDFQAKVSNRFSTLGDKVEWRVESKDGKKIPRAMIVRFNAADRKDEKKTVSSLVVIKIGSEESCITDVVSPSAKQNDEARALSDSASSKPCKANNQ